MKKSIKIIFIISAVAIVLGIGCTTFGFLQNPSHWLYLDKKGIHSGKSVAVQTVDENLDEFSNVYVKSLGAKITICSGNSFHIKIKSQYINEKVTYGINNGSLVVGASGEDDSSFERNKFEIIGDYEDPDNSITITVPKDTTLNKINVKYLSSEYYYSGDNNLTVEGIKANSFEDEVSQCSSCTTSINNCFIDAISEYNIANISNTTAKSIVVNDLISSDDAEESVIKNGSLINLENVKCDSVITASSKNDSSKINEEYNDYDEDYKDTCNAVINNCTIGSLNLNFNGIKISKGYIEKLRLNSCADVSITNGTVLGETNINAVGDISVDTGSKMNSFNINAECADSDIVTTKLVSYKDPQYLYGYDTEKSKLDGTVKVYENSDEYKALFDDYPGDDDGLDIEGDINSVENNEQYRDEKGYYYIVQKTRTVMYFKGDETITYYNPNKFFKDNFYSDHKIYTVTVNGKSSYQKSFVQKSGKTDFTVKSSKGNVKINFAN